MVTVDEGRDLPDFAFAETIALLTCSDTESVITASSMTPGVIITFSGDNTNTVETDEIMVTEPGLVSINFLNPANGCETTQTVLIEQDITPPMPVPDEAVELNCQVLETSLSVTTNEDISAYEWSGIGITSATDIANPTVDQPGLYTVIVTALDNGCTAEVVVEVMQDMDIPMSLPTATEITCSNPIADLIGTGSTEPAGNISYLWTGPGGFSSTDLNTTTDVDGDYTLTVSNSSNQCDISTMVTVGIDEAEPMAEAGDDVPFPCSVDEVTLAGSGMGQGTLSYEWTNSTGAVVGNQATIQVSESGMFTLEVTDSDNGCTFTDVTTVIPDENAPIIDIATYETLTCEITSIALDASATIGVGTLTYVWTASSGAPAGTGPIITVSNPDNYNLVVSDGSNGCVANITVPVDQNTTPPVFTLDAGIIDCIGMSADVLVENLTTTNPSFSWEGPTGSGFTSDLPSLIGVTQAGTYSVTITDEDNGCTAVLTGTVESDEDIPESAIADPNMLDCETEEVQLQGSSITGTDLTFSWEGPSILSGGNSLTPIVNAPGIYELTTTAMNGCISMNTIEVLENTDVITAIAPEGGDVNCFGPNTGSIALTTNAISGGTAPYIYSIDGGASFTTQQDFLGLTAGEYDVVVQDARGCEFDQVITINPAVDLIIDLGEDQVIAFGDSLMLNPVPNFDIEVAEWNDTLLIGTTPFASPINTTIYEITAFDEDGCVTTDFITVFVEKTRPVYIPSGFSPNGDGINDFFTVYVDADLIVGVKNFNVYDRWGETMYSREDLDIDQILNESNGWDGVHRTQDMNPGVYVYHLVVEFIDGEEILYEGNITLTR